MSAVDLESRTNATLRLHHYLARLSTHSQNGLLVEVLVRVLEIKDSDPGRAEFKAFAVLYRLIELAQREIQMYSDDVEYHLQDFPGIISALGPRHAHEHWQLRRSSLKEADLKGLSHTGRALRKQVPEGIADAETLKKIEVALADLRSTVEGLTVEAPTKHQLRERIRDIQTALDEYKFWGVADIQVSFAAMGVVVGAHQASIEHSSPGNWPPFMDKLQALALKVQILTSTANVIIPFLLPNKHS